MAETSTAKAKSKFKAKTSKKPTKRSQGGQNKDAYKEKENLPPHSWGGLKSLFSCKDHNQAAADPGGSSRKKCKRIGCSGSLCNSRDTNSVMQRTEAAATAATPHETTKKCVPSSGNSGSSRSMKDEGKGASSTTTTTTTTSSSSFSSTCITASTSSTSSVSSVGGSFRGMQLRRFSGCYECHMVDPINGMYRLPSLRVTVQPCPDCGEIFMKSENLELHQAVRHAVSQLGPEDTSRNIVEIIFQSSWLKKQPPVCKIDRILKVHNTQKTITRFEDYRDSIKSKASKLAKKHPRCVADGNELLRFHCTTLACPLGLNGATNLCHSIPHCNVCGIIRDGFKTDGQGRIRTMATSGRAHDAAQSAPPGCDKKRAMLVCRVVAGRVRKSADAAEEGDSVAGATGVYSNLDELFVFNPKSILPCFVVVYSGF